MPSSLPTTIVVFALMMHPSAAQTPRAESFLQALVEEALSQLVSTVFGKDAIPSKDRVSLAAHVPTVSCRVLPEITRE
jgi:hypothetical protein